MDVERALLKAGVTVAAMFAIYQGSQGMREFAEQRSRRAHQELPAPKMKQGNTHDAYIEALRLKETERRSETRPTAVIMQNK